MSQNFCDPNNSTPNLPPPTEMDRPIKRLRIRPWLISISMFVVVLIASGFFFVEANRTDAYIISIDRASVDVATVVQRVFKPTVVSTGQVNPSNEFFIENRDAGRIEEIFLKPGARVFKGEPIVRLSNTDIRLSVLGHEAQVAEQISNLNSLEISFNRAKVEHDLEISRLKHELANIDEEFRAKEPLFHKKYIAANEFAALKRKRIYNANLLLMEEQQSKLDLAERATQIENIRVLVKDLKQNLVIAKQSLEDLVIRSGTEGVLASLDAEVGQFKGRGSAIGKVFRMDTPKVIVLLDEFYLPRLNIGGQATYRSDSNDLFELGIKKISPEVKGGRIELHLAFLTAVPDGLIPGQSMEIEIRVGKENEEALILPNKGFIGQTGGRWVFVLDPNSERAVRRSIVIGERSANDLKILKGLQKDEQVIVSSYRDFSEANQLILE